MVEQLFLSCRALSSPTLCRFIPALSLRPPLLETSKPDPTLFLRAAKALQLSPDRCVVVEDAPAGMEAAHKAGMSCIAVATTRSRDVLAEVTSLTLLFDDLTQVKEESFSNLINIDL